MATNCIVTQCGKPIHPERLLAQPRVKTCSHRCSVRHHSDQQALAARNYRSRKNPRPPVRRKALRERDERIMRALIAGEPVVEVAGRFNLSARSIFRILARENNQ